MRLGIQISVVEANSVFEIDAVAESDSESASSCDDLWMSCSVEAEISIKN